MVAIIAIVAMIVAFRASFRVIVTTAYTAGPLSISVFVVLGVSAGGFGFGSLLVHVVCAGLHDPMLLT